ncbi:hypothetical protein H072_9976 [Dactylellina haptotyla CBS 200.50]|uniref:Uncharacterized protein n=1 Tax=Dactylellina haptotyla (strain CBS 200.50) TaxID=1284197 RepID=S8BBF7_DACHA|nr:hypothetical protein H072_9976 [Dactylellina haptotyla CBS 200.50]
MSYPLQQQHSQRPGGIFATNRNKSESAKPLTLPNLPTISTSLYDDPNNLSPAATTRASTRAQLLAGLRTAPKATATGIEPGNISHNFGDFHGDPSTVTGTNSMGFLLNKSERAFPHDSVRNGQYSGLPLNAARSICHQDTFPSLPFNHFGGLPTPPTSSQYPYTSELDYETKIYAELLSRNISLAQHQHQHHQQLVQQMRASQQLQQMQPIQIQSTMAQSLGTPPMSPAIYTPAISSHQLSHSPYAVYNQATQFNYFPQQTRNSQAPFPNTILSDQTSITTIASQLSITSPSTIESNARTQSSRSSPSPTKGLDSSTAKKTPSPPPISGPAFRRGHKKCISLSGCSNSNPALTDGGPKTSIPRFSNVPSTPINSTFGGRGDHPVRQPRGPPALEEIMAKPSAKLEGSKNFSSRQRRRALTKLVNAGIERRGTKTPTSSAVGMMSVSEHDVMKFSESELPNPHPKDEKRDGHSPTFKAEGRRTPRRAGLAAPQLAAHSAEKRRSAIF